MMQSHMKSLEQDFVTNGGIRECMTAARLGARASQKEIIEALQHDNEMLIQQINQLTAELNAIKGL